MPHSFMEIARTPGLEKVQTGLGVTTYDGIVQGMGASRMAFNRGKKSVVLDLKQEDDLETMRDRSLSGTSM